MNCTSISVWGLVYSCALIGSKRVSLPIALFFNNFEAKPQTFLFQFETKLLLSASKLLGFETLSCKEKNCSMNRCLQHGLHGVLGSFVVFSTFLNQLFRQRQECSITNQGLEKSPAVYVQPRVISIKLLCSILPVSILLILNGKQKPKSFLNEVELRPLNINRI